MADKKILELSRSDFAENFLHLNGRPLSLDDYPHMRAIYNESAKNVVMKFSRQCVDDEQILNLSNGSPVLAKDIREGDEIIGFNQDTLKNVVSVIKHK